MNMVHNTITGRVVVGSSFLAQAKEKKKEIEWVFRECQVMFFFLPFSLIQSGRES